jgi:hypothetical protein
VQTGNTPLKSALLRIPVAVDYVEQIRVGVRDVLNQALEIESAASLPKNLSERKGGLLDRAVLSPPSYTASSRDEGKAF